MTAPLGFRRFRRFKGHQKVIYRLAWSMDGMTLFSASRDYTMRGWDLNSSKEIRKLPIAQVKSCVAWSPDRQILATDSSGTDISLWSMVTGNPHFTHQRAHNEPVLSLAWSPDGSMIATGAADYMVRIWSVKTFEFEPVAELDHSSEILSLAWSPDGARIATGGRDRNVRIYDTNHWRLQTNLTGHSGAVSALTWAPNGKALISGGEDSIIKIWSMEGDKPNWTLESHTAPITAFSFSPDMSLMASKGRDETVRLWDTSQWKLLSILREEGSTYALSDVAFHPNPKVPLIATLDEDGCVIDVWQIDLATIRSSEPEVPSIFYSNAKVIMVGEEGAGKTSLGNALMGREFTLTSSTHGLHVWQFDISKRERKGQGITYETLLWDLAGQENYRLIHQLYLRDVALSLLVFDSNSVDPFHAVYYWNRALSQHSSANGSIPMKRILVEARIDQGGGNVSKEYVEQIAQQLEFAGHYQVSAYRGDGVEELRQAIRNAIDWNKLPQIVSSQFFENIQAYLRSLKDDEDLRLSTSYELFNGFMSSEYALNFVDIEPERVREQFETCIGFLETMGLMRRFKFGGLVLLKPELLDFYASAIINAAKHSQDGFGTISEWKIWNAEFYIPEEKRLTDKQEESWMLIATVDDLLNHEICFRSDGYLIFPSHFVQEYRDIFELAGHEEIEFVFEGPIANIYAIIIVRLARSGEFMLERITRNKAMYFATNHGRCSLKLDDNGQGAGTLTLYFEDMVPQMTRYSFELFIYKFLREYSLKGSVLRNRIFTCSQCHVRITNDLVKKRLERGFQYIVCPVCEHQISLVEPVTLDPVMDQALRIKMKSMGKNADIERKREAAKSMLEGKMATGNLDVMMIYSQRDRHLIDQLAQNLRDRGVYPEAEIGEISSQDLIEEMIPKVRSVAIFPGVNGELPTDNIHETVTHCKRAGLSVMIGILPNSNNIPKDLLFIKETKWVYFFDSVGDELALNELEFGITGKRPD